MAFDGDEGGEEACEPPVQSKCYILDFTHRSVLGAENREGGSEDCYIAVYSAY